MSEMTIKLDLDTLRALFAGDDKPAVEFRNAIANKFASEYLKSLVTSSIAQQRDSLVLKEVERILKETVLEDGNWRDATKTKLQAHYRNMISITIDTEVSNLIKTKVDAANAKIDDATKGATLAISNLRNTTIETKVKELMLQHNVEVLVTQLVSKYIEKFATQMLSATLETAKDAKEKG